MANQIYDYINSYCYSCKTHSLTEWYSKLDLDSLEQLIRGYGRSMATWCWTVPSKLFMLDQVKMTECNSCRRQPLMGSFIIVLLLGVVTLGEPVSVHNNIDLTLGFTGKLFQAMIVLELLSNGDLFKYLHKIRPS